jgi:hypothetical protein
MVIFDPMKRIRKRNRKFRYFVSFSNLASIASSERKMEIRKKGRKLIIYLEVNKC